LEIRNPAISMALLVALGGCGDDGEPSSDTRGAAGGGASATAGTNGAGATAGTGAVGGGGSSGVSGRAYPIFFEESGIQMNGISLTGDELELYYSRNYAGSPISSVVRRRRATKTEAFSVPEYPQELADVCEPGERINPDVTEDGLALYVTCTQAVEIGTSEGVSTLRVARRTDRSSAFVLEPEPIGGVFASAGISADELTAYTDGEIFNTAPSLFTRASKTESFGEPQPVPGITEPLNSLDISHDGLALFGSATSAGAHGNVIFRVLRNEPSGPFGAPEQLDFELEQLVGAPAIGAPNITPGGTLYLIVAVPFSSYMVYAAALE
jgi:hypothetical protein